MTKRSNLLPPAAVLAACCALGAVAAPAPNQGNPQAALLGLAQLRSDFHLAGSLGDYDLMRSLWTDDAVFRGGGNEIVGGDAIADFFAANPGFGTTLSLTSESKTTFDVRGNMAQYEFECIIVSVPTGDPLQTSLSTIPFGSQNPSVEIIQHSSTSGTAVREDGRWKFLEFNGSAGPN